MNDSSLIHVDREGAESAQLELRGEISAFHATTLHQAAMEVAELGRGVVVECSGVESLDYSAIQILLALKNHQTSRSLPCDLVGVSPDLAQSLALVELRQTPLPDGSPARVPEPVPANPCDDPSAAPAA